MQAPQPPALARLQVTPPYSRHSTAMSPFPSIWAPNQGGSTTHIPAEDLQLRVHVSRESETTVTPTLDARTSSTHTLSPPPLHHSPRQLNDDALGDFFGGRRAHRTRTQHRAPPPYSQDWDGEKLPGYTSSSNFEMETVARHMFKYGFCTFCVCNINLDLLLTVWFA